MYIYTGDKQIAVFKKQNSNWEKMGTITIEDVKQLGMRVGRIIEAKPILNSDRLLEIKADLGAEQRTLVAGLAGHYSPAQLIGIQIIVVSNMKPSKIKGVLSDGMMLGVGCNDGKDIALLTTNRDAPNGAAVE